MKLYDRSGNLVELSLGFKGGSEFFDLIDFLKTPNDLDKNRTSRSSQLNDFFKNFMIYGFAPSYNKHIADGDFDLAANLLNEINKLSVDELTCLRKRDFLERKLDSLSVDFQNCSSSDFSYIMCDLDNFKAVNDTYGHSVGDDTLTLFGKIILDNLRPRDVAFRYGGEEFSILLPETNLASAGIVANRIRESIEDRLVIGHYGLNHTTAHDLSSSHRQDLLIVGETSGDELDSFFVDRNITCSFGVSSYTNSYRDTSVLKELADSALYQAKDEGRNKVVCKKR